MFFSLSRYSHWQHQMEVSWEQIWAAHKKMILTWSNCWNEGLHVRTCTCFLEFKIEAPCENILQLMYMYLEIVHACTCISHLLSSAMPKFGIRIKSGVSQQHTWKSLQYISQSQCTLKILSIALLSNTNVKKVTWHSSEMLR